MSTRLIQLNWRKNKLFRKRKRTEEGSLRENNDYSLVQIYKTQWYSQIESSGNIGATIDWECILLWVYWNNRTEDRKWMRVMIIQTLHSSLTFVPHLKRRAESYLSGSESESYNIIILDAGQ